MNIPRKINRDIEQEVNEYLKHHYNLQLAHMDYLSGRIVKIFYDNIHPRQFYRKSSIMKYYSLWFKTTNIKGDMTQHSGHSFAVFMDANFYVKTFDRGIWWHNVLFKVINIFL